MKWTFTLTIVYGRYADNSAIQFSSIKVRFVRYATATKNNTSRERDGLWRFGVCDVIRRPLTFNAI